MTLRQAILNIIRNPWDRLIRKWNWKSALFSALLRGAIFFAVNISAGMEAALTAVKADVILRTTTSGFYGSLVQAFRKVEPPWKAALAVMVLLPVIQHAIEFLAHWFNGTANLKNSIIASLSFTILAALFNLYAMRRGTMIVGSQQRPFLEDMKAIPGVVAGFLLTGVLLVKRAIEIIWTATAVGGRGPLA